MQLGVALGQIFFSRPMGSLMTSTGDAIHPTLRK